jgi:hypothetical protein
MSFINFLINIELKLKQYKIQFLFLIFFWFGGFIFFYLTQPSESIWIIFLYSLSIRRPISSNDFISFYTLIWPILLEVIVFGFIMGELLEKYNPVITCRILAKHRRNHTVIIGYQHLSERVVDLCISNKKRFCVIEDDEELVEDLVNSGYPVVIGDPTELYNLNDANIKKAKEIFINVDDARIAIICTEKVRQLNDECPIYVRAFEDHVQDYLEQPPLNALAFSTSKWAMEVINEWTKGKKGTAIVIGRDRLTHRIAHHISLQPDREVYLFDDEHDGIEFIVGPNLHIIQEFVCFLSDLRPYVDLDKVSQVFICWMKETEFDEALYLTSKLDLRYPNIEIYVRIFDEELKNLVEKYGAQTFSTSQNAFRKLQNEVSPDSAITLKK